MNSEWGNKMRRNNEKINRVVAYLAFLGAILDAAFWVAYLAGAIQFSKTSSILIDGFESAFLFADAFLGLTLVLAGIGLLRNRPYGSFFAAIASSMALYLGMLDITFYSSQGLYLANSISSLIEIAINAACIIGGITGLLFAARFWRVRREAAQVAE
jgi:hypothetical protein